MPGFVIHMAAAKEYLELLGITDKKYINDYIIGTVAPDIVSGNQKKESHFWSDFSFTQFVRKPDVDAFYKKYETRLNEPYFLGYYHHLLMDLRFLELYWTKHFSFMNNKLEPAFLYDEVTNVKLMDDGKIYPRELFFSDEMYYGDYTRLNGYYIEKYDLRNFIQADDLSEVENVNVDTEAVKNKIRKVMTSENTNEAPRVFVVEEIDRLISYTAKEDAKYIMRQPQE